MTELQIAWLIFLFIWLLSGLIGTTFIIISFKLVWDEKHLQFELEWVDFLYAALTTLCGPICLAIGFGMYYIGKKQQK